MFEHAATIERLVECVLEPRSMYTFRLVLSRVPDAVVYFNGETREIGADGTVEGSFVRAAGTRVAVVAPCLLYL